MNKPPQKVEPITIEELTSVAEQFADAAKVLMNAVETMKEKGVTELGVLYKTSFFNSLQPVGRAKTSAYDAWRALQMGKTVKPSRRSVVNKKSADQFTEQEINIQKAKKIEAKAEANRTKKS